MLYKYFTRTLFLIYKIKSKKHFLSLVCLGFLDHEWRSVYIPAAMALLALPDGSWDGKGGPEVVENKLRMLQ